MSLHIDDVRRIHDFGIGTYIRSLVQALGEVDPHNHYTLIISPAELRELPPLPANFEIATYGRTDDDVADHVAFPAFLREIPADLFHIPLESRAPNDAQALRGDDSRHGEPPFRPGEELARNNLRQYTFRRGLIGADRVIAVSSSTRRDVENLMGVPRSRIRLVYSAPNPAFFEHENPAERERILERYEIHYPFLLYAGAIRPQKNIPRLVGAFAIARTALADHPEFRDLRLVIIGDEISALSVVRQAVRKAASRTLCAFSALSPSTQ